MDTGCWSQAAAQTYRRSLWKRDGGRLQEYTQPCKCTSEIKKQRHQQDALTNFRIQHQTSSIGCLLLPLALPCIHIFLSISLGHEHREGKKQLTFVTWWHQEKKKGGANLCLCLYHLLLGLFEGRLVWDNVIFLMESMKQQELVPLRATAHQCARLQRSKQKQSVINLRPHNFSLRGDESLYSTDR